MKIRIATVVAHFDDEIIWCLATRKKLQLLGTEDLFIVREVREGEGYREVPFSLPQLEDYDVILTHGEKGEYGHPHHIEIHKAILSKYFGKVITFGGVWDFQTLHYLVSVTPEVVKEKIEALDHYKKTINKDIAEIGYMQSQCALEGGKLYLSYHKRDMLERAIKRAGVIR